jgi:hypothetical protein
MRSAFGKPVNEIEPSEQPEKQFRTEVWWKTQPTIALTLGINWFCHALVNGV